MISCNNCCQELLNRCIESGDAVGYVSTWLGETHKTYMPSKTGWMKCKAKASVWNESYKEAKSITYDWPTPVTMRITFTKSKEKADRLVAEDKMVLLFPSEQANFGKEEDVMVLVSWADAEPSSQKPK